MTESERSVESAKNPILKGILRFAYDYSVGFVEIGQGNHQPQFMEILTKSTPEFFLWDCKQLLQSWTYLDNSIVGFI